MRPLRRIARSNFFIKLRNWEYWPFGIIQLPVFLYFFWLAFRARSVVFFSASNPGIPMGGMFGESKYDVIKKIPSQYVPKTVLIQTPTSVDDVEETVKANGFTLPVIFKPELGERGFMVKRIFTTRDIDNYLGRMKFNFLIQALVDLPLEFGVFYARFPSEEKGKVTSIVAKEMLSVTGDGRSTLQELILAQDRAKLQWEKLKQDYASRLDTILAKGEKIELVSIGNHAMGTKFLDGSHLINDRLSSIFDHISKQIEGFYFGRFDIRCASLEELYNGNIKILELNGCGAEPAHIYDPAFKLGPAIGVLLTHWRHIFEIARENHKLGVQYTSFKQGREYYKRFKAATR